MQITDSGKHTSSEEPDSVGGFDEHASSAEDIDLALVGVIKIVIGCR